MRVGQGREDLLQGIGCRWCRHGDVKNLTLIYPLTRYIQSYILFQQNTDQVLANQRGDPGLRKVFIKLTDDALIRKLLQIHLI